MLFDILLFDSAFYPLPLVAFSIEVAAIVVFSLKEPNRKKEQDSEPNEASGEQSKELEEQSPLIK